VFGNLDDPCNANYEANDTSALDQGYRDLYAAAPGLCQPVFPDAGQEVCHQVSDRILNPINGGTPSPVPTIPSPCEQFPYHQSIDVSDPTMSELNAGTQWNVTAGPHGSIIDRYQVDDLTDTSAGGLAQSVLAVPYYRDDACFDDGTGTNPGPRVKLRSADEPRTYTAADGSTQPRECWRPGAGAPPEASERYYQGSIGTHGLHLLMVADSDNARQTVPVTEIVADQRMVVLPDTAGIVAGERYGRGFEKPLVATPAPAPNPANEPPVASFAVDPDAPHSGREVRLTSTSADAEEGGGIDSQEWDLDADGGYDDAEGAVAAHVFTTPGEHEVGLRVTDTSGAADEERVTITVTNPAPTATVSYAPEAPVAGEDVTLTAAATDANGSVVAYAWDLDGDGELDDGTADAVTHAFAEPGDHPVAVRVTDDEGAATEVEATVTVVNRPPTAAFTFAPQRPVAGDEVVFTSTSADPDGPLAASEWDLDGDGTFESAGDQAATRFAAPGAHVVTLRVSDPHGGADEVAATVEVAAPASGETDQTPAGDGPSGRDGVERERPGPDDGGSGSEPTGEGAPVAESDPPVAIVRAQRVRVTRRGVARVRVACRSEGGAPCNGRVVLERRRTRVGRVRAVRLGRARLILAAGESRLVEVRLNRAARALLRRRGPIRARAVLTTRSGDSVRRSTRRVALRPARA
jgi:PKD repeat protein